MLRNWPNMRRPLGFRARHAGASAQQRETNVGNVRNIDERITELHEKLRQLKARQARIAARRKALDVKLERRADTRRKILAGAILLARVQQGRFDAAEFRSWLEEALTQLDDRELFGL